MPVIKFYCEEESLILEYSPTDGNKFVLDSFKKKGEAAIRKAFYVTPELRRNQPKNEEDEQEFEPLNFEIGKLEENYFQLNREVLGIEYDLFISPEVTLEARHFIAVRDISIFRRFNEFEPEAIYLGGEHEDAIPEEVFAQFIEDFPTSTEVSKYARARIESILGEYLQSPKDFQADFEKLRNKRGGRQGILPRTKLAPYEGTKFAALHDKLSTMLENFTSYNEKQWQEEILEIILLLFPRYIRAFREAPVKDSWTPTTRNVDFLLLDASGYIDVIEIKKPSFGQLVTVRTGRDNHVPKRELSEAVMQVEKYLYHFNRWGEKGEGKLNDEYSKYLPDETKVRIVNPTGMIIMGRAKGITPTQRDDFEIIRRKYRHVVDIITYDDLLSRLKTIADQFDRIQTT